MYEYTDKVILYLRKYFIEKFNAAKSMPDSELNILAYSKSLYDDIADETKRQLVRIGQAAYKKSGGTDELTEAWILGILDEYDPVTKYVFNHETERKKSRFAESIAAAPDARAESVKTALRLWSAMVTQYAISVTDRSRVEAMKSRGVRRVKWVTVKDGRQCNKCDSLSGKIFDIKKIPVKPHIHCRCYVEEVHDDKSENIQL